MDIIQDLQSGLLWLRESGFYRLAQLSLLAVVMVVSFFVARRLVLRGVNYIVSRTTTKWDDALQERGVFRKVALLAPATVVFYGGYLFNDPAATDFVHRLVTAYVVAVIVSALGALLAGLLDVYEASGKARKAPIKGYVQVATIVVYLIGAIVIFAVLLDKSPWALLSGLGAATAILILVFRDTILSFVASIQIASNDTLRVGDWVSMPKYHADGDVIDIALHAVRIQNWDKSITSIPTHRFLDESFRNWRGMFLSGGRRIKRSISVDQSSIRFLDRESQESLRDLHGVAAYLDSPSASDGSEGSAPGSSPTNLGAFRAFAVHYLKAHPEVHQDRTFLVRSLEPSSHGLPIELYVFCKDTRWAVFEGIQSEIVEHLLASLPTFGLRVFQYPVGADFSPPAASSPNVSP